MIYQEHDIPRIWYIKNIVYQEYGIPKYIARTVKQKPQRGFYSQKEFGIMLASNMQLISTSDHKSYPHARITLFCLSLTFGLIRHFPSQRNGKGG